MSKAIYWSHSPRIDDQSIECSLVTVIDGRTFRVTLHWDRSYSDQTRGSIDVLVGAEFKTALSLFHHDMMRFADLDAKAAPVRGDFERAGKIPALLRQQADELAALGARIVGPKVSA